MIKEVCINCCILHRKSKSIWNDADDRAWDGNLIVCPKNGVMCFCDRYEKPPEHCMYKLEHEILGQRKKKCKR